MQEPTEESQVAESRSLAAYAVAAVFALLTVGAFTLVSYWLWSLAGHFDASGGQRGLTAQLMQRKTATMSEIYNGLAAGDFDRAKQAAALLRRISETAQWYLSGKRNAAHRDDFRDALRVLEGAFRDPDVKRLQTAYDRLAESCVRCHQQATKSKMDAALQFFNTTDLPASER